jgi:3'(2'), 5'-bisphosphate nucleotidase
MTTDHELEEALRIARTAEHHVRSIYGTSYTVELKAPGDPVTRADREASDLICASLAASFPGDAILSEESVPGSVDEVARRVASPRVWFVDPLDGTREFTQRIGEFAVMIGLAVAGRATLGVVVMPAVGEAIAGRVSASAFAEDQAGARRPLAVSSVSDPERARIVVSRSHRPPLLDPLIARLRVGGVIPCGSVGVKVARLVLGEADLYVHDGGGAKLWDTCAPEAVLSAAGGRLTNLRGEPIDYTSTDLILRDGIVATNGALHEAVLSAVAALGGRRRGAEHPDPRHHHRGDPVHLRGRRAPVRHPDPLAPGIRLHHHADGAPADLGVDQPDPDRHAPGPGRLGALPPDPPLYDPLRRHRLGGRHRDQDQRRLHRRAVLVVVALKDFSTRVGAMVNAMMRCQRTYLVTMGLLHGLTNLGGSLLTALVHARGYGKNATRVTTAVGYATFAVFQTVTLAVTARVSTSTMASTPFTSGLALPSSCSLTGCSTSTSTMPDIGASSHSSSSPPDVCSPTRHLPIEVLRSSCRGP